MFTLHQGLTSKLPSGKRPFSQPRLLASRTPNNKNRRLALLGALGAAFMLTALSASPTPAMADTWSELKPVIFKDIKLQTAAGEITLKAPYRAADDRRVPVTISADLKNGEKIRRITFIIDENPMPVSAIFDMSKPSSDASFSTFMRLNGPSTLRAVLETESGKYYMTQRFVKTSGQGACAAPPVGDPEELLVDLGKMQMEQKLASDEKVKATRIKRRAHLKIKHPNLTGLQMDQITLRYILARFVNKIEIDQGDEKLFTVTGSISFSENPELTFDYNFNGSDNLKVKMVDTDKASFTETFPVGIGS